MINYPLLWDHGLVKLNNTNSRETSPMTEQYNCIAYAAGDIDNPWWPDKMECGYWPPDAPREETLEAFIVAFKTLGYEVCCNSKYKKGYIKIAIYVNETGPTHAAIQNENGKWMSKLGDLWDIEHDTLEDVCCLLYGKPVLFLIKSKQSP